MGFGDGFSPSKSDVDSSTKTGGSLDQNHQFTGSIYITASVTSLSASSRISASHFIGDGSHLTNLPGGGGGGGDATSPADPDRSIQFNNGGDFGGNAALTYTNNGLFSASYGAHFGETVVLGYQGASLKLSGSLTGSIISGTYFHGNGSNLHGVNATATPAGADRQIQFNNDDSMGANAALKFTSNGLLSASYGAHFGETVILYNSGDSLKLSGTMVGQAISASDGAQFGSEVIIGGGGTSLRLSGTLSASAIVLNAAQGESPPMLVVDDTDGSARIGRTHIGYDGANSDMAVFAHQDNATQTNFSLRQRANGQTELNAKAGQSITFKVASATKMQIGSAGDVGIGPNYSPGYLLDVSGSTRLGGGAASSGSNHFISGSVYMGAPTTPTFELNAPNGTVTINANTGENSGVTIAGPTSLTGSGNYDVFKVECENETSDNGRPSFVVNATGVGFALGQPSCSLDVAWNPTGLGDNTGGGERVYFGTPDSSSLHQGALYYLNDSGRWASASAGATGSGENTLLGISIHTNPQNHGMVTRGYFDVATYFTGTFVPGRAVYIHSGAAGSEGYMSSERPSGSDSYARIVGYGTSQANVIYFNPGTNWVELN